MILNLKDSKSKFWFSLFIVSLIGIVLMISSTFIEGSIKRENWKEYIILWFYFTFISNVFALVVSSLVIFKKVNFENRHLQRVKVMMAVSLTITSVIFWSVIIWTAGSYSTLQTISTTCVHAITPILALVAFFIDGHKNNILKENKNKLVRTTLINLIFPIIWLVVAIIIYFAMGADEQSAIYTFLDFNKNIGVSFGIISIIAFLYPALTSTYTWIYNK